MRRLIVSSICLVLLGLLAPNTALFADSKDLKITIILWRGETKAEQGFKDRLKELGYSVQYTVMNAGQDKTRLGHLLRQELEPKLKEVDYIYTFGTTVSKMTKTLINNRVPQLFNIVTAPVDSGIVQSMQKTGENISGATHSIPVSVQIEAAWKIMQFKRLGFFFNPREHNSMIQRERLHDVAKKYPFEVVDLRSPPALDMLQQNLKKLTDKSVVVDAVYLPSDSFLISRAKLIGSELRTAKVKSIGSHENFIENGVLLGAVADYYKMGKAIAGIVDRHQKGEILQDIPVQHVYKILEPTLMINKTTSQTLKIQIPENLLGKAILVD